MKEETSTSCRHTDPPRWHLQRPPPSSGLRSAGRGEPLELTGPILSALPHLGPAAGPAPIIARHPFPPRGSQCLRTHFRAPTRVVCHLHPPSISILHPPSLPPSPALPPLPPPPPPRPGGQTEAASILWHQPRSLITGVGGWGAAKVRRGLEFEGNLFCLTSPPPRRPRQHPWRGVEKNTLPPYTYILKYVFFKSAQRLK